MKYHVTTIDGETHAIDLPVEDSITWTEFVALPQVVALGIVTDVTPDGMPKWFSDEEMLSRQLTNLGIRRTRNEQGISQYSLDEEE